MALSTFFGNEKKTKLNGDATNAVVDVEDQTIVDITGQSDVAEGRWLEARYIPPLDLYRNEQQYTILIDLPGIDPNAIKLSVQDSLLTISGTRDISISKYRLVRSEIISSDFERIIRLPREANKGQIQASYKNGVLEITIERAELASSHRLAVESTDEEKRSYGS